MSPLPQADLDIIAILARHYRCPVSELEEMRRLAETDSETMESYRRMAANIVPQALGRNRTSPAYLSAMAELERLGVKRRKSA